MPPVCPWPILRRVLSERSHPLAAALAATPTARVALYQPTCLACDAALPLPRRCFCRGALTLAPAPTPTLLSHAQIIPQPLVLGPTADRLRRLLASDEEDRIGDDVPFPDVPISDIVGLMR